MQHLFRGRSGVDLSFRIGLRFMWVFRFANWKVEACTLILEMNADLVVLQDPLIFEGQVAEIAKKRRRAYS